MSDQNLNSLGIDISSFSPEKLKILQNFIDAFNKLDKYDSKVFKPVLGGGLVDFNNSIQQTNKLLDELDIRLNSINSVNITPKATGATKEVKDYSSAIEDATRKTKEFSERSAIGVEKVGKTLTEAYSTLRKIAYVIPGLGIAGIFDLAFKAIERVVEEMGLISPTQNEITESQIKVNKQFSELLDIIKSINSALHSTLNETLGGFETDKSLENVVKFAQALNKSAGDRLENERHFLAAQAIEAQNQFNLNGGFQKEKDLRGQILAQEDDLKVLIANRGEEQAKAGENDNPDFKSKYDKDIELAKLNIEISEKQYNEVKSINEKNAQLSQDLAVKEKEIIEHNAEERRKLSLEISKAEAKDVIDKNQIILNSETSSQEARIKALDKIQEATEKINNANENYILAQNSSHNHKIVDGKEVDTGLTTEGKAATIASNEASVEAERKNAEEIIKVNTEFYQRKIKATTESQKEEIEQNAITEEKIFKDTNKSLDERIAAYSEYLVNKQKLQVLIEKRDLQQGADRPGGTTSLTVEETERIYTASKTRQVEITANAEREIYDIVYSSLQKQLKDIEDETKSEEEYANEKHINDLNKLNERFNQHKINAEKYWEERKKIEKKGRLETDRINVQADQEALKRLTDFYYDKLQLEIENAKHDLDVAKAGGDPDEIAKAQGKYDALLTAQGDFDKAIKTARDKQEKDLLKQAEDGGADQGKVKEKWSKYFIQIEKELYRTIKELVDQSYEYRIKQVEKYKDLIDEQYGYEISAIEKSSLTAKDKAALDVQLNEQKREFDIKEQVQEKQLKIKEAEFDKKLAIAHIGFNTAEAVTAFLAKGNSAGAITAGILGGIELVAAAGVQIPSYKHGTPGTPGGISRYGEDGWEVVKEPNKSPYLVTSETISYLPMGTQIIPVKDDVLAEPKQSDGWAQTRWLGAEIRKNNKDIKNIFRPTINIDLGFENYKREKLYGK